MWSDHFESAVPVAATGLREHRCEQRGAEGRSSRRPGAHESLIAGAIDADAVDAAGAEAGGQFGHGEPREREGRLGDRRGEPFERAVAVVAHGNNAAARAPSRAGLSSRASGRPGYTRPALGSPAAVIVQAHAVPSPQSDRRGDQPAPELRVSAAQASRSRNSLGAGPPTAARSMRRARPIVHHFPARDQSFDTADVYVRGAAERALGAAIATCRANRSSRPIAWAAWDGPLGRGSPQARSMRWIRARAAGRRLRRFYQAHAPARTPIETLRAFEDLVRAGKARYVSSRTSIVTPPPSARSRIRRRTTSTRRFEPAALQPRRPRHRVRARRVLPQARHRHDRAHRSHRRAHEQYAGGATPRQPRRGNAPFLTGERALTPENIAAGGSHSGPRTDGPRRRRSLWHGAAHARRAPSLSHSVAQLEENARGSHSVPRVEGSRGGDCGQAGEEVGGQAGGLPRQARGRGHNAGSSAADATMYTSAAVGRPRRSLLPSGSSPLPLGRLSEANSPRSRSHTRLRQLRGKMPSARSPPRLLAAKDDLIRGVRVRDDKTRLTDPTAAVPNRSPAPTAARARWPTAARLALLACPPCSSTDGALNRFRPHAAQLRAQALAACAVAAVVEESARLVPRDAVAHATLVEREHANPAHVAVRLVEAPRTAFSSRTRTGGRRSATCASR